MGHWDRGEIFDDLVESMAGKSFQELVEYDLVHWCQGFLADNLSAGVAGRYPPPKSTSENICLDNILDVANPPNISDPPLNRIS